ncbi:hypothetical protein BH11BAC6_BH11BAC6_08210 [soil metagenome]
MKKFLLLSFLIASAVNSFAFVTQGHWRWRKDDGSETTATWLATEETTPIISSGTDNIRLRIEFFNANNSTTDLNTSILVYSADGGTTWDSVTHTIGTKAFMLAGTSPFVIDNEPTTQQLTGETGYTFVPGRVIVSTDTLGPNSLIKKKFTEYEWVIKPTVNILPNTTYLFKGDTKPGDNTYDGTLPPASLTTAGVLAIKLANFTLKAEGKQVKIQWSTASEQNNDHFDIERSNDGRTWKTIATVKGNGSTNQTNTYQATDNMPLKGINYYHIKQYDINGKTTVSDVRSIKMFVENNSLLSVYPNPSKGAINFRVQDYSGNNVTATLTNSNGKIIHSETIKEIQANATYTLNVKQQPAPGIYILQLKGEGLQQTIKVVVQ